MGRFFLLALMALAGAEAYGFFAANPIHLTTWYPEGPWKLVQFTGLYVAFATTLLILLPWTFGRVCAAALLLLAAIVAGPLAVLAVAFLMASAYCLGRAVGFASPLLTGLSVYIVAMTLLARVPVHHAAVYLAVLSIPIALRWHDLTRLRVPEFPLNTWGERASFGALAFSLATHLFAALKPETSADGLAMHLAIPMDIAAHHSLTFEPSRWVWAVMPMGGDFLWSVVYVLGGEFAAHLFNYALLLVLLAVLYDLLRQWIPAAASLLLLALFASSPMVEWMTGALFVENLLAVLLLGAFAMMRRDLFAAALLAGAAVSVKLGAATVVLVAMPFVAMAMPKQRRTALLALAILLVAAAPPYVIAWAKTGNPLFPFVNERFHSPLLASNTQIADQRYHEPLTWSTPYTLTFHTHAYSEGRDGVLGFQYLLLAPLALLAIFAARNREVATAAVIALVSSVIILRAQPIARYLYPALPLFYIPLAWAVARYRVLLAGCGVCIVLNTCALSAQGYYYTFYPPFAEAQRAAQLRRAAPMRLVTAEFNRRYPGEPVLLAQDSFHAGLSGDVYENHWHQAGIRDALRAAADPADVHRLLERWRVGLVIAQEFVPGEYFGPDAFRQYLQNCALPEYEVGGYLLERLEPNCDGLSIPSSPPRPLMTAELGIHDDFSRYPVFRGGWIHDDIFPSAYHGTISYNNVPGAVVSFAFQGSEVIWTFTRAPNRGIATVTLDGIDQGTVDQYAGKTEWQARHSFRAPDHGPHLLVIRVAGRSRPEAEGRFIDIDTFEVKP